MENIAQFKWEIPLEHRIHKVELKHDLKSNQVKINVDGKETLQCKMRESNESDVFKVETLSCNFKIEKIDNMFHYSITVDGKSFRGYKKEYMKRFDMWRKEGKEVLVVYDRYNHVLYGNGKLVAPRHDFVSDGCMTYFEVDENNCHIETVSSPITKTLMNVLYINNWEVPVCVDKEEEVFTHAVPPPTKGFNWRAWF
uniref:DUF295 domain-containing protein n=1 Tax=Caenorhabditis tropicalis TaxID=1561998 RepID=A0A1I7THX5_9PELO